MQEPGREKGLTPAQDLVPKLTNCPPCSCWWVSTPCQLFSNRLLCHGLECALGVCGRIPCGEQLQLCSPANSRIWPWSRSGEEADVGNILSYCSVAPFPAGSLSSPGVTLGGAEGSWVEMRFTHPSAPHPEAFLLAAPMGDQSSQGKTPTLMGDIHGHCKHSLHPLQNSHWDKLQPCVSEK